MKALPTGVRPYARTRTFTEASVPAALTGEHDTRPGVWGLIVIEAGRLIYEVPGSGERHVLTPERPGVVEPTVAHRVTPDGPVRFHIAFHR